MALEWATVQSGLSEMSFHFMLTLTPVDGNNYSIDYEHKLFWGTYSTKYRRTVYQGHSCISKPILTALVKPLFITGSPY